MPSKPSHDHELLKFPKDFLWGTATSAHQVEGNNKLNDWWAWENEHYPAEKQSRQAADQYNLYEKDFDIAKSLAQNSHRLSIEWSRVEPAQGQFDQAEIDHYKKVLKALKDRGFTVMLTLWHFTLPQWVAEKGGWENLKTVEYFENFVKKIAPELSEYVDFWVVLNEPGVYVYQAYQVSKEQRWPGSHGNFLGQLNTFLNFALAYRRVYKYLKGFNKPTGIAQNIQSYEAYHKHSIREMLTVMISDGISNHLFYFLTKGYHDFIGINYYFHWRYRVDQSILPELVEAKDDKKDVSDLGWEVYPEGIFDVLTDMSDGLPIYITECGIASTNDDRRTRFLIHYLQEVYQAIHAGVNIKGFFYWSLIDNYEWGRGFDARFGLVEVDFKTQARILRPSAEVYGEIAQHNGIPHKLLKLLGHTLDVKYEVNQMIKEGQI